VTRVTTRPVPRETSSATMSNDLLLVATGLLEHCFSAGATWCSTYPGARVQRDARFTRTFMRC
jgi:hypothetical protein